MSSEKVHLRHCMLYEFRKGQSATQAVANINEVYGPDAVKVRIAQYWFSKFRDGNFNLEDAERSGRPSLFDSDDLRAVINADPFQSCQDIAQTLSTSTSTAFRHLKQIGMVSSLKRIHRQRPTKDAQKQFSLKQKHSDRITAGPQATI